MGGTPRGPGRAGERKPLNPCEGGGERSKRGGKVVVSREMYARLVRRVRRFTDREVASPADLAARHGGFCSSGFTHILCSHM